MPVNGNIRKFRFDLSLNDRKIFDDLGDHLIELTKTKLIKIVEDVAERTGKKDLVLDKLEIDIGPIDINNLDSLTKAFEKELLLFFQKKEQQLQQVGSKKQEQALLFFIEKGYYPWWINNRQRFNSVVLDLEATTTFSDQFLATVFSDQKKYFRLVDALEPAAKKNFINKLLGSNLNFFQSLIRFFVALQTTQIITSQLESSTSQLRAFEYDMIHQIGILKQVDKQGIFYSGMEYISKTFNIPLAFLLSMLSEKLDVAKLDSEIKTLLNSLFGQKQERDQKEWKDIPSLNTSGYQNSLFSIMGRSNSSAGLKTSTHHFFNAVLQYLEKGIFENSFDVINDYKIKFEFLIRSNSIRLIQHLSTVVFLKSKIKMERLATLSSNLSLDQLTDWLDTDSEAKGIIEDLRKIFSNKEFKDALAYYDAKILSQTFFRKAILAVLLRRKEQYESGSTFINTFIQEYTKTGSIERNELLLELYRMGDKKNYNQASNRLFEALFSSSSLDTVVRKGEDTMATESAEKMIGERFSKLDEVAKMNVQDSINFLLSIFSQLRDITDDLEQLQFPRSLLAYLDTFILESFFKRVKSQINFSIVKLIDDLIKEYALAFDKKDILRIYQVAFYLLMSKPNILNSSQFKEELIKRLLELEPSIKIHSPTLKKDLKSKALQDVSQLEAMKKEDLNQWVVELFLELPDTKKELEQLLFQRAFSSIINFTVMKAVLQQLNKKMKFDVIEKVDALIDMAKDDQKKFLRQQGFRSSFQILTSKGIQISSDQFSEALQQDLIRHYPQSFESETKSSAEKTKKESVIGEMIKEISKRIDGNAQKNSETISIEKFETLLQLKQDILINSEEYDTDTLDISFESYADIILSKENFLRFLKTHFQDHELMMAFAEIGLQPENTESLEKLVDSETGIFDFEKRLLELQSQFNIVVLPYKSFKVILRTFILKKIGAKGVIQELTELEIVIDLFESLKRENFINLQQLSIYLETKTKKPSEESLAKSLTIFTLKSKFTIPNSKVKDILYFKDLVFSYLKTDSIPSWANVENFDLNDVIIFIKTMINKEDRSYLLALVRDPKISERFVSVIQAQNEKEKMKFLELVQQSYANFNLAVLIEELKIYFGKITLTNKTTNIDFFIDLILAQELWKQNSLLSFIERLVSFIPKKASLKKTELLKHLHDKGFNISKSFFQTTKKQALSDQELIEVLKFFLETNNFPKNYLAQEDQLQSQIQTLLLSQDAILESLLNEYSYKPKLFERLFTFVEFRDLFRFIEKNRIYQLSIFAPFSIAIYELEDKKRFSRKEQAQLLVSLLIQFEKQVTETKFKGFLTQMMQERSTQFED
ncbi:contractile injection system tape measure protein, partial [Flavobacteriaceae bacterium]|nr:contractile injection system tape measure protein [Flavobacteriaceae bacterium]